MPGLDERHDLGGPLPPQLRAAVRVSRRLNRSAVPGAVRGLATERVGGAVAARLGTGAVGAVGLPGGGRVVVPLADSGLRGLWLDGTYEEDVHAYARAVLRPGDCAVDLCAGVGVSALRFAALVGPAGVVHAVEPGDRVAALLARSIELSRWQERVVLHRDAPAAAALTDRPIRLLRLAVDRRGVHLRERAAWLVGPRPEHVIVEISGDVDAEPTVDALLASGHRPVRAVAGALVTVPLGPLGARRICFSHPSAGAAP